MLLCNFLNWPLKWKIQKKKEKPWYLKSARYLFIYLLIYCFIVAVPFALLLARVKLSIVMFVSQCTSKEEGKAHFITALHFFFSVLLFSISSIDDYNQIHRSTCWNITFRKCPLSSINCWSINKLKRFPGIFYNIYYGTYFCTLDGY